jgi:hypothetical protein
MIEKQRHSKIGVWTTWATINVLYVLGHPHFAGGEGFGVHSFAVCSALFLLPGAAIFEIPSAGTGANGSISVSWCIAAWLSLVLVTSVTFQVGTLAFLILNKIPVAPGLVWNISWLASNLLFFTRLVFGPVHNALLKRGLLLLFASTWAAAYLFFVWGATSIVPPMEDHDFETQGTAYALMHRLEPLMVTDRETVYYFAHPPLLHFYVGLYFLYTNQINNLKYYDDASLAALRASRGEAPRAEPGDEIGPYRVLGRDGLWYSVAVIRENGRFPVGQVVSLSYLDLEWERIRSQFHQTPALWPTRAPSLFLAALTVSLLVLWSFDATQRWLIAIAVGLAYSTSPEVFVRSSYGGYFSIENFAVVLTLCISSVGLIDPTRKRAAFAAGLFSALTDHKLLFLPLGFAIWELVRPSANYWRQRIRNAVTQPTALGFATGIGLFWIYALSISPSVFWQDHIRNHLYDRLTHENPLGYDDYPSIGMLWNELSWHTGYLLLPISVLLLVLTVLNRRVLDLGRRSSRAWSENVPAPTGAWLIWLLSTALAFSWIDWRQTKHLMPILPALYLAPSLWLGKRSQYVFIVICLYSTLVIYNFYYVAQLSWDFAALKATPIW